MLSIDSISHYQVFFFVLLPDESAHATAKFCRPHVVRPVLAAPLAYSTGETSELVIRADRREAASYYTLRRRIFVWTVIPVGIILILAVILLVMLQNPTVQYKLMVMSQLVHTPNGKGMPIDYQRVSGLFPYKFTMHGVAFTDPKGNRVEAGTADVHVNILATLKGQIELHSVVLRGSTAKISKATDITQNEDYSQAEIDESVRQAVRRATVEIWPGLPFGITIKNLTIFDMVIPLPMFVNITFNISGEIWLEKNAGDFYIDLTFLGGGHNASFILRGVALLRHVTIDARVYNTSELCSARCDRTVSLSSLFPDEKQPFALETRMNLIVQTDGTYSDLLQLAYPYSGANNTRDLIKGVAILESLNPRALYSSLQIVFKVSPHHVLIINDGRLTSPILLQTRPLQFGISLTQTPPYQFMLHVFRQELTFPTPFATSTMEFVIDQDLSGYISMEKSATYPFSAATNYTLNVHDGTLLLSATEIAFMENQVNGSARLAYSKQFGLEVIASFMDVEQGAAGQFTVIPTYENSANTFDRQYSVHFELQQEVVQLGSLVVSDIAVVSDVVNFPKSPTGTVQVSLGEVNYGNGVFVLNNASVAASRAQLTENAWEINAKSDTDLKTRFTLFIVASDDQRIFHGSIAPFMAILYGKHRVWTSDVSTIILDFGQWTYNFHSILHVNQNPSPDVADSIEVIADNTKSRIIVKEDISLFNGVMPKNYTGSGWINGYLEFAHQNGQSYPSSVDLCWNNGRLFGPDGQNATALVLHGFYGCVTGTLATGWKIDSPPAQFYADWPDLGNIELRSNITVTPILVRIGQTQQTTTNLAAQIQFKMLDQPTQMRFFENGWIAAELNGNINL